MAGTADIGPAPSADTPDAVAPPPRHPRFPLFDGLRAVAVFLVLFSHTTGSIESYGPLTKPLAHTNIGVTIFFLISGFLLYRPFIAHRTGGPLAPRIGDYAKRRVLRIFPAYWVCLTILVVFVPGAILLDTPNLINQYLLLQTLPIAGEGSCVYFLVGCDLAHTWSLAIEATFYVSLPLYVTVADRLARGRPAATWMRLELALLAAISLGGVLARYVIFESSTTSTSLVTGTLIGTAFWFALGMGLAVISVVLGAREREPRAVTFIRRRAGLLWLAALALYVALSEHLPPEGFTLSIRQQVLTFVVFGLSSLLLLLPAVFSRAGEGAPQRFLASPVIAWLGLISYGIFLWHNPVIIELQRSYGPIDFFPLLPLACAISIVIAAASYYAIERPAMRFKYRPLLRRPAQGRRRTTADG